jgi:SulP family sulfate permease
MASMQLHRFRPRLLDTLRDYDRARFARDVGAGITVGVVALPLAMAFAIASGLPPEAGLFTAVVAGFLISALGGSSVQIGGPAGAFIVIVYGIVERHGLGGLMVSTLMAGVLMFLMGLFRLGALVRYVPVPIIIGFTNGIAVLIALSQLKDFLGLQTPRLPADFFSQIGVLAAHLHTVNPVAVVLAAASLLLVALWPKGERPDAGPWVRRFLRVPGTLVALVAATLATVLLQLPVDTIGSRFGGIPQGLPALRLPDLSWAGLQQLIIPTLTIALLGAVESLLCARVADNLAPVPRHDPNQELMAQGVANIASPLFGGLPATGTIARTVTNVRAGAVSPVSGMVHAVTLLVILLAAAPLALHVPLPALAGILLFVAWNMGEWREFARLRRFSLHYRTILVGTFVLTVVFDLTVAFEVGLVLACAFFIRRMAQGFRADVPAPQAPADPPAGVCTVELVGSLFFGAVSQVESLAERVPADARAVVVQTHRLVLLDTSGLEALEQFERALHRRGVSLWLAELEAQPRSLMLRSGFLDRLGPDRVHSRLADAVQAAGQAAGQAVAARSATPPASADAACASA